jgi:L-lysine 2,3-aminomutase
MTSDVELNEGSQVPLVAACYPDMVLCVPVEGCGAKCTCCVPSHCVTASEDLMYDVKFVASAQLG